MPKLAGAKEAVARGEKNVKASAPTAAFAAREEDHDAAGASLERDEDDPTLYRSDTEPIEQVAA